MLNLGAQTTSTSESAHYQTKVYQHNAPLSVRPFSSQGTSRTNLQIKRDRSDTAFAACEQLMEQIAAMIDYDIQDYLPPGSQRN